MPILVSIMGVAMFLLVWLPVCDSFRPATFSRLHEVLRRRSISIKSSLELWLELPGGEVEVQSAIKYLCDEIEHIATKRRGSGGDKNRRLISGVIFREPPCTTLLELFSDVPTLLVECDIDSDGTAIQGARFFKDIRFDDESNQGIVLEVHDAAPASILVPKGMSFFSRAQKGPMACWALLSCASRSENGWSSLFILMDALLPANIAVRATSDKQVAQISLEMARLEVRGNKGALGLAGRNAAGPVDNKRALVLPLDVQLWKTAFRFT